MSSGEKMQAFLHPYLRQNTSTSDRLRTEGGVVVKEKVIQPEEPPPEHLYLRGGALRGLLRERFLHFRGLFFLFSISGIEFTAL